MARPTIFKHQKFQRLVYLLRQPLPHVVGYLECMWHVCYESGRDLLGDEVDVELACQWPGEPGALCALLLQVGLIDRRDGKYAVHDLDDHAPDYVAARRRREEERGKEKRCAVCSRGFHSPDPRSLYCSAACRKASYRRRHGAAWDGSGTDVSVTVRPAGRTETDRDGTPAPAPAPAPAPLNTPLPPSGGEELPAPRECKKQKQKPAAWDGTLPPELDAPDFRDAWRRWEADRRARRKPLTEEARRLGWKKCIAWGVAGAIASIEASIVGGWQGLFDPPAAKNGHAPKPGVPSWKELLGDLAGRS